jgi:hypothetical protein
MTKHEKKGEAKSVSKLKAEAPDLDATRKAALDAQAALKKAGSEATALVDKAAHLVARASSAYREAVAAYREACRKAGVECECPVGSSEQEDSGLAFVVETTDDGARVIVKGKPGPKDIVPLAILKATLLAASLLHSEETLRPRRRARNKGGNGGEKVH